MKSIPESVVLTTGDQHKVTKTIDDFFLDTKKEVQRSHLNATPGFELKSGELAYRMNQVTDDRITYLSYNEKVIAAVFETRTEFNQVRYTFFRNLEAIKGLAR